MSEYIKQNFTKGQTLKADHLNHMEDGIASVAERVNGLSGGAGTDWNENDPTSASYVQNRTHWVEIIEGNAEFDGNLTGREFIQAADDLYFVKMSSTFLTEQELIGRTIKMYTPDEIQEMVIEESFLSKQTIDENNYLISLGSTLFVVKGDLSSMGFPLTEGVWFLCQIINPDDPNEKAYVMSLSGLTGDVEIVHKLNEKFLPDISYTKLVDKPEFPDVPEDVVRYDTEQDLYSRQRKIARENIDAASGSETSESLDNIHAALVTGHLSKDLSFFPLDSIEKLNSAWIMSIEKETFKNNDTLTSVNLPNVTSIEDQTFYMCSKLATINMPNVEHIGYRGLAFCCLLTDIKFPNLTSMGEHCFVGNDGLVLVNDNMLPKITYISANAFNNCSNLITVDLSNVTSLDGGAFMDCEALTSVNLPNVTTFESGHQFCDCYALTEVNLPKVVSLGTLGAFNDCSSLIAIDLPNTIEVSNESFRGCEALTNVNLPNAITIGDRAFGECLSLRKLDLPKVASIGEQCFFGGVQLEALILRNTESMCTAKGDICASYSSWGTGSILHIYVPRALIEDYKVAENWSQYASKFRALEDYTVDGTVTGELDETKI